ncbi:FAD-dependent monooxygenase [Streptomyces sp. NPDC102381]|uniref:FAD-dependent monooxygenase n=1 Tax=Streptomyces sp. NPDC102381 TaxID=3366164 RepID=UPI0037FBF211
MSQEHFPVLVVGAGTVGLSMAAALAHYDVPVLLVERHAGTTKHPRATGVQPPVKEFFRSIGLDDPIREASTDLLPSNGKVDIVTIAGSDLAAAPRIPTPPKDVAELTARISPTPVGPIAQDRIDQVLGDAAAANGALVRFGTRLESVEADESGVTATLVGPDGAAYTVRADHLVAADGSASSVRQALGIELKGPTGLGNPMINILFTADLSEVVKGNEFAFAQINNPDTEGILLTINNRDRWIYHISYKEGEEELSDYPDERCVQLIKSAIGRDDIPVEVVSTIPWRMSARVAERVVEGRVILAGDSAHTIPPIGAFGMSSGVADACNLAWKLAHVVKGIAGPGLLRSYEAERLPIMRFTRDQALLRFSHLDLHWDAEKYGERSAVEMADPLITSLAYQYDDGAVIDPPKKMRSLQRADENLTGAPGTRVPHAWVGRDGKRISVLDLVEKGNFVLLTGPRGGDWVSAARAEAADSGLDLRAYRVGPDCEVDDPDGAWSALAGLEPDGALLVRPDMFVAWRSVAAQEAPQRVLTDVLDRVLDRAALPSA